MSCEIVKCIGMMVLYGMVAGTLHFGCAQFVPPVDLLLEEVELVEVELDSIKLHSGCPRH